MIAKAENSTEATTDKPDTMSVWSAIETTDPRYTKEISGRDFGGTSVSPTYRAMQMTKVFGACGEGWGYDILDDRTIADPEGGAVLHTMTVQLWHGDRSQTVIGVGATKMFYTTKRGDRKVDEEFNKKSLTDALGNAMNKLGMNADIWLGKYDDDKYVNQVTSEFADRVSAEQAAELGELVDQLPESRRTGFYKAYSIESVVDLPATKYAEVRAMLTSAISNSKGGEA